MDLKLAFARVNQMDLASGKFNIKHILPYPRVKIKKIRIHSQVWIEQAQVQLPVRGKFREEEHDQDRDYEIDQER